ncbi:MAG: hypothetical protein M3350_03750 [Actinomycetota bacterium]|nr:hypothetical protein [Actinomycetota bacterium]MDQ3719883.1 hypothetical protein [Actinomycetota bacterium]
MGFLDAIFGGKSKLSGPAPDRLFAMTTAQVHLETALNIEHRQTAGIVFQALGTADFSTIMSEAEELLKGTAEETGTQLRSSDDEFGYRWLVLEDPDFEDLVVSLNTISSELQGGGYGDRLLACVFAFEEGTDRAQPAEPAASPGRRPLYLIYNFKRGSFYPFVPAGEKSRDTERELRLKAQLGAELPIEADTARWFPLWEIPL